MLDLRPFSLASAIAALGFTVEGVIAAVHPVGDTDWDTAAQVLNGSFAVAVLALAFALPYLGRWLQVGKAGRFAVGACQLGAVLMAVESVASGVHGGNTLGGLFFAGVVLMTLGLLALGIAGLRAGAVRWAAMLPFAGWFVSIAGGDVGGSVLLAAVLLVLASAVVRTASAPVPVTPAPARAH
jgi:hypothetical protein